MTGRRCAYGRVRCRIPPQELRAAIREIRSRTARPFGVNLLLAGPEAGRRDLVGMQRSLDRVRRTLGLPAGPTDIPLPASTRVEHLRIILDEGVPVLSVAMGDPAALVADAHAAGVFLIATATTVEEACRTVDAGVDAVVAQGAEAGGHRSTFEVAPDREVPLVGTMALVRQVVNAVRVPVLAAGGVADGRGVVAALALGAFGVPSSDGSSTGDRTRLRWTSAAETCR